MSTRENGVPRWGPPTDCALDEPVRQADRFDESGAGTSPLAAARHLAEVDRPAFELLRTVLVTFRHQYRFRLEAGDFLLYDNWRMLHARTAFTGARWVRGVYFDAA